jgi:hypothetical protein
MKPTHKLFKKVKNETIAEINDKYIHPSDSLGFCFVQKKPYLIDQLKS